MSAPLIELYVIDPPDGPPLYREHGVAPAGAATILLTAQLSAAHSDSAGTGGTLAYRASSIVS